MKQKPPPCIKCVHYYVTYQKNMPCGCRLFEIKSKLAPTFAIKISTGIHCPYFELKTKKQSPDK